MAHDPADPARAQIFKNLRWETALPTPPRGLPENCWAGIQKDEGASAKDQRARRPIFEWRGRCFGVTPGKKVLRAASITMRAASIFVIIAFRRDRAMDRIEAGFFVTAVTSAIVLVAAISWLAVLS
jgi:hypothetical protein